MCVVVTECFLPEELDSSQVNGLLEAGRGDNGHRM
jgi:hypothetical protein